MNLHPIIHSGLARERQRDLERETRKRQLAMRARGDDGAAPAGRVIRDEVPGGEVAPARLAEIEDASVSAATC